MPHTSNNLLIACCGLDCSQCEARLATINNDDTLREKVARQWAEWNHAPEIKTEDINCTGCRIAGCKTYYCSNLCKIRLCVHSRHYSTCIECPVHPSCSILGEIVQNNPQVLDNLASLSQQS